MQNALMVTIFGAFHSEKEGVSKPCQTCVTYYMNGPSDSDFIRSYGWIQPLDSGDPGYPLSNANPINYSFPHGNGNNKFQM